MLYIYIYVCVFVYVCKLYSFARLLVLNKKGRVKSII